MNTIKYNKKTISILIFIFLNLLFFKIIPTNGKLQEILTLGMFFLVNPLIYSKFILKNKSGVFGFKIGDSKNGLFWSGASLLIMCVFAYVVFNYTDFTEKYSLPAKAINSFSYFIYYELVLVLFFTFIYEFFFRGFLVFHLRDVFGRGVVVFQALVFITLVLLGNGGFNWNLIPYLIFLPFAGWIAYKSESLVYSLVTQSIFIIIVDMFFIKMAF